jgi:hypothetical protein
VTCCHCSIHGASVVIMGVRLLQWNGFAFDSNPADTLRLLHRGDYITSFLCLDNGIRVRHCVANLAGEGLVSAFMIALFHWQSCQVVYLSGSMLYVYACDTNHAQHPLTQSRSLYQGLGLQA